MTDTQAPPEASAVPLVFEAAPAIGHVETDCFCDGCHYSLRGQPIRLEPHTQVPMARCSECGRFAAIRDAATAGRLWLNRVIIVLTWLWVFVLIGLILAEALVNFGIVMSVADELQSEMRYSYHYSNYHGDDDHELRARVLTYAALSLTVGGMGLVSAVLLTGFIPHWRWWGYLVLTAVRTVLTGSAAAVLYWVFEPDWWGVAAAVAVCFMVVHGSAGLIGSVMGRLILRVIVQLVLPRRARSGLLYLWLADGLEPK